MGYLSGTGITLHSIAPAPATDTTATANQIGLSMVSPVDTASLHPCLHRPSDLSTLHWALWLSEALLENYCPKKTSLCGAFGVGQNFLPKSKVRGLAGIIKDVVSCVCIHSAMRCLSARLPYRLHRG